MNIEEIFDEVFYSSLSIDDLRTLEELRIYYEKVAKQCDFNNHLNESITKLDNILDQFILTSDEKIYVTKNLLSEEQSNRNTIINSKKAKEILLKRIKKCV